jgi:hypothetical protein
VAINIKKMKSKQPLTGTNMPGSATNKKVMGPVDKAPVELNRDTDKLMKGTTTAGAGETPQEDSKVNQQSKEFGPALAALFTKGLRGEDTAGKKKTQPTAEDARIKKGTDILTGKTNMDEIEGQESGQSPTYKDWKQLGETNDHVIIAVSKKKAQF